MKKLLILSVLMTIISCSDKSRIDLFGERSLQVFSSPEDFKQSKIESIDVNIFGSDKIIVKEKNLLTLNLILNQNMVSGSLTRDWSDPNKIGSLVFHFSDGELDADIYTAGKEKKRLIFGFANAGPGTSMTYVSDEKEQFWKLLEDIKNNK